MLVRYCDDLVVLCRSQKEAEGALVALTEILQGLGLEPKASKTRIVHLVEGAEGLDFLGFHHRWVSDRPSRSRHRVSFLARWPTRQAMQRARDRIRQFTMRSRVLLPVEEVVGSLNRFLRGWVGFFRYGNSTQHFIDIRWYAQIRLARFVAKRHGRRPAFGRWLVGVVWPTSSAWSTCQGSSLRHGRTGHGGESRMPTVNGVGELDAGEPHAQFDGRALETEQSR